jgi:DNA polymerase (family X)
MAMRAAKTTPEAAGSKGGVIPEIIDKKEAAKQFNRMAVLLELAGENPFKARAYANAARAIESFDGEFAALAQAANDGNVKGIGKGINQNVQAISKTGRFPDLEQLENSFPDGLLELLKIQGLGPKKVKRLHDELGISTLGELEYACLENRLAALPGFGNKSQKNVLAAVEHLKQFAGRFHIHTAIYTASALLDRLKKIAPEARIEICGSIRRAKETVKDIDLLVVSDQPDTIMEAFVGDEAVARITGRGEKKSSVILKTGIAVDLRVFPAENFPAALVHFTGSAEHNTRLRSLAKTKGLKLSEWGLFDGDDAISLDTEREVYEKLGLPFIPPSLREDLGEVEAAENGELPQLIERSDLLGMLHVHTTFSDGTGSVAEMAEACRERGYSYLGITDHSRTAVYAGGLTIDQLMEQREQIDSWNGKNPGFRVFAGIESDILPDGSLDYPDEILASLDFVIASVHSGFTTGKKEMTERIVRAVENRHSRILGHPTGRLLLGRVGYELDMDRVIDACIASNVVIELNANPHRLDIDWRLIRGALKKGAQIAICPDAHSTKQLDFAGLGLVVAQKGWCEKKDVINTLDADRFEAFCREGR